MIFLYKTSAGRLTVTSRLLVELEVEDMNAWMKSLLNDNNLAFVTYSKSQNEMNITENDLMAALKAKSSFSDMLMLMA